MNARALVAENRSTRLVPASISINDLHDDEVLVRITHCGLCRSDLTRVRSIEERSSPLIAGHEIIGEIVQSGRGARETRVGSRVGIGWQSGACGGCLWCSQGQEHLCLDQEETCVGRQGGFATHIKVQARFAIPIPDALPSAHAAPLMCAGITVFSPILRHSAKGDRRAAVVGIGGLGHLALQFLRALGSRADVFSTAPSKEADAREFGACAFYCLDERTTMKLSSTYDFILSTSPALRDVTGLLRMLRPRGVLCLAGLPRESVTFSAEELIGFQKSIEGTPIGSPGEITQMLKVAVEHGVTPRIECFPMSDANTALQRLEKNQIRYRAVLVQDLDPQH